MGEALPTIELPRAELERGIPVFQLLQRAGLTRSNSEARSVIRGGGGRINGAVVDEETRLVTVRDLDPEGVIKLSAGRKRHALVRAV